MLTWVSERQCPQLFDVFQALPPRGERDRHLLAGMDLEVGHRRRSSHGYGSKLFFSSLKPSLLQVDLELFDVVEEASTQTKT